MMGQHDRSESLFYYSASKIRFLKTTCYVSSTATSVSILCVRSCVHPYSETGRPSIDPEVLSRIGVTSRFRQPSLMLCGFLQDILGQRFLRTSRNVSDLIRPGNKRPISKLSYGWGDIASPDVAAIDSHIHPLRDGTAAHPRPVASRCARRQYRPCPGIRLGQRGTSGSRPTRNYLPVRISWKTVHRNRRDDARGRREDKARRSDYEVPQRGSCKLETSDGSRTSQPYGRFH